MNARGGAAPGEPDLDLSVDLGGLRLAFPTLAASGCFGSGAEYGGATDLARLGAIVLKSVTPQPRAGNSMPRLVPTPSGLLNAIGLQNPGIDAFLERDIAALAGRPCKVVGSVAGFALEDFARVTERLAARAEIDAIELNVSCPNVAHDGELFACEPELAAAATRAARAVTAKPLLVKLSPSVTRIAEIARAVEAAGADALVVANTVRGMAIDVERRAPALGNVTGGLSGAAIRPIALLAVWETAQAVAIPIVGLGGIGGARDALEFVLAGASAVAIGTGGFIDPRAAERTCRGIAAYLVENGFASLRAAIGAANPTYAGGR